MPLQSSGEISIKDITNFFSGPNTNVSINIFYRGGNYVRTFGGGTRTPASGDIYNYGTNWWTVYGVSGPFNIYVNGNLVGGINPTGTSPTQTSYTMYDTYTNSYATYFRSTFQGYDGWSDVYNYSIYYYTSQSSINTNVPSSGQIKFNDFWGGSLGNA
jgi:hypothetical protein